MRHVVELGETRHDLVADLPVGLQTGQSPLS
jgi:hypothetical protein